MYMHTYWYAYARILAMYLCTHAGSRCNVVEITVCICMCVCMYACMHVQLNTF